MLENFLSGKNLGRTYAITYIVTAQVKYTKSVPGHNLIIITHKCSHSGIYKGRDYLTASHRQPTSNFHSLRFFGQLIPLLLIKNKAQNIKNLVPFENTHLHTILQIKNGVAKII